MTNEQSPAAEPQPQPYVEPKGPEFGGPGYEEDNLPVPEPEPDSAPAPVAPYEPPAAAPLPVVPPTPQPLAQEPPAYGYGGPNYHPMPYYQGYGPQMLQPEHPSSTTVAVLGIMGIFFGVLSPVAWIMGHNAKKSVERGAPYRWGGLGQTGYVLGIVFTVLQAAFWALIFFVALAG